MSDNELAIAIVAIVFGSIFGIFIVAKLAGLIKAWINRNNSSYDEEKFDRMAKAFIRHKKDTERRLKELETNSAGNDTSSETSKKSLKEARLQNAIQIESSKKQPQPKTKGGNLHNMLKE